jgi:hypothetical protein
MKYAKHVFILLVSAFVSSSIIYSANLGKPFGEGISIEHANIMEANPLKQEKQIPSVKTITVTKEEEKAAEKKWEELPKFPVDVYFKYPDVDYDPRQYVHIVKYGPFHTISHRQHKKIVKLLSEYFYVSIIDFEDNKYPRDELTIAKIRNLLHKRDNLGSPKSGDKIYEIKITGQGDFRRLKTFDFVLDKHMYKLLAGIFELMSHEKVQIIPIGKFSKKSEGMIIGKIYYATQNFAQSIERDIDILDQIEYNNETSELFRPDNKKVITPILKECCKRFGIPYFPYYKNDKKEVMYYPDILTTENCTPELIIDTLNKK